MGSLTSLSITPQGSLPFLKIYLFDQHLLNAYYALSTALKSSLYQKKENLQPKGFDYVELPETRKEVFEFIYSPKGKSSCDCWVLLWGGLPTEGLAGSLLSIIFIS